MNEQFWIGEEGLNWWLGKQSNAEGITVKVTIPKSYVTPGHKNYIFTEEIPLIDFYPGGTVGSENLAKLSL